MKFSRDAYPDLYRLGVVTTSKSDLGDAIDEASRAILSDVGLPVFDAKAPLLGLVFEPGRWSAAQDDGGHRWLTIGYEEWLPDKQLLIVINATTSEVLAARKDDEKTVFMNESVLSLILFLGRFKMFHDLDRAAAPPIQHSKLTMDEVKANIAAFRRGELKPPAVKPKFDRPKAFKTLKEDLASIDAAALQRNTWWSRILEQVKDEQI